MTNEELKKQIIGILLPIIKSDKISCNEENACERCWFPCEINRETDKLADALIAAGLRFGENLTATFDHMALEREHELERRAEIAERALNDCVEYYSYSALCPVLDCNYNKACWRKECTSDIVECFKIQAEEELKKESKD